MAYQIKKTDQTVIATVVDGQIDDLTTDISLIGKNSSNFGQALNENFIKLLENFSGTQRPNNPINGQLWFDAAELKLKVYARNTFIPVGTATISDRTPTTLGVGDLWFNSVDKQLYFFDGTNSILLAPDYSESQGVSGIRVQTILDTFNQTRVIVLFYAAGILMGIFSKDKFTPKNPIIGFTGGIEPGFNVGNHSVTVDGTVFPIRFNVTSTNAEKLNNIDSAFYARRDQTNTFNFQLRVLDNLGIVIGSGGEGNIRTNNGDLLLINSAPGKDFSVQVKQSFATETAMLIKSSSREIEFYPSFSSSSMLMGGSLTVQGDLTVNGTTTVVNTENVVIEDKNLVLAKSIGTTPTDANASGGGITLQGANSHALIWTLTDTVATSNSVEAQSQGYNDSLPALKAQNWNSTQSFNLAGPALSFSIGGNIVLDSTACYVTSFPNLTSIGVQVALTVDDIFFDNNRISTLPTNRDLELAPNGNGNIVLIGSPRIIGMENPINPQDASTKEYVDDTVQKRSLAFSIDLSDGKPNIYIINEILNRLAPVSEYRNGTRARILCNITNNSSVTLDINSLLSKVFTEVNTPSGTAFVLGELAVSTITVPGQPISITRIVKLFEIENGIWTFRTDTILP
jgi:hypothetical protein